MGITHFKAANQWMLQVRWQGNAPNILESKLKRLLINGRLSGGFCLNQGSLIKPDFPEVTSNFILTLNLKQSKFLQEKVEQLGNSITFLRDLSPSAAISNITRETHQLGYVPFKG